MATLRVAQIDMEQSLNCEAIHEVRGFLPRDTEIHAHQNSKSEYALKPQQVSARNCSSCGWWSGGILPVGVGVGLLAGAAFGLSHSWDSQPGEFEHI